MDIIFEDKYVKFLNPNVTLGLNNILIINDASAILFLNNDLVEIRMLRITSVNDINSLTDNTTDGQGNIPVPGNLTDLYDTINGFFFNVSSSSSGTSSEGSITVTGQDLTEVPQNPDATALDSSSIEITWDTPPEEEFRNNVKVCILGDSFGAGIGASNNNDWVTLLRNKLQENYNNAEVINFSVSDYTTYHILDEHNRDDTTPNGNQERPSVDTNNNITAALAENPDIIIVNMTSNDVDHFYQPSEYIFNIQTLKNICDNNDVKMFITDTAPRTNFTNTKPSTDDNRIENLSMISKMLKQKYPGILINIYDRFLSNDFSIHADFNAGDDIHVNDTGHLYIANQANDIIESYLMIFATVAYYIISFDTVAAEEGEMVSNGGSSKYIHAGLTPDTEYFYTIKAVPYNGFDYQEGDLNTAPSVPGYTTIFSAVTDQSPGATLIYEDNFADNTFDASFNVTTPNNNIVETNGRLELQEVSGLNNVWDVDVIVIDQVVSQDTARIDFVMDNVPPASDDQIIAIFGLRGSNGAQAVFYSLNSPYTDIQAATMNDGDTVNTNTEGINTPATMGSTFRIEYNIGTGDITWYEDSGAGFQQFWTQNFNLGADVRPVGSPAHIGTQTDDNALVFIDTLRLERL